jgi:hypothetical protein
MEFSSRLLLKYYENFSMSWYYHTSKHIIVQSSDKFVFTSPEFIGAFSGAFFAFIFGIISYRIIKRYERFIQHKGALVQLERLLNEHIDLSGLNRTVALNTQSLLSSHHLTRNRFVDLPLQKELNTSLGSLEIANKYFSYERSITRINIDTQSLNYTLLRFEDVMIGGGVLEAENWYYVTGAIAQIPGYMNKIEVETRELLALVRINIARLSGKGIWYANINKKWDVSVTEEELRSEMKKLNAEINDIEKRSKTR